MRNQEFEGVPIDITARNLQADSGITLPINVKDSSSASALVSRIILAITREE